MMYLIKGNFINIILILIICSTSTDLYKSNNLNVDKIWEQYYNLNSTNFVIKSILQAKDDGYIIMGRTDEMSGSSYTVKKTDNQGIEKWSKSWGGDFHIYCMGEYIFELDNRIYLIGIKKAIPRGPQPIIWFEVFVLDYNGNILYSRSSVYNSEEDFY